MSFDFDLFVIGGGAGGVRAALGGGTAAHRSLPAAGSGWSAVRWRGPVPGHFLTVGCRSAGPADLGGDFGGSGSPPPLRPARAPADPPPRLCPVRWSQGRLSAVRRRREAAGSGRGGAGRAVLAAGFAVDFGCLGRGAGCWVAVWAAGAPLTANSGRPASVTVGHGVRRRSAGSAVRSSAAIGGGPHGHSEGLIQAHSSARAVTVRCLLRPGAPRWRLQDLPAGRGGHRRTQGGRIWAPGPVRTAARVRTVSILMKNRPFSGIFGQKESRYSR